MAAVSPAMPPPTIITSRVRESAPGVRVDSSGWSKNSEVESLSSSTVADMLELLSTWLVQMLSEVTRDEVCAADNGTMTKNNFGGLSARQIRRAQKANPAIKDVASAAAPLLMARTGESPGGLLKKILSGDPETRAIIQSTIAEQQAELGVELSEEEVAQSLKDKKKRR